MFRIQQRIFQSRSFMNNVQSTFKITLIFYTNDEYFIIQQNNIVKSISLLSLSAQFQ
jgi:hypothetical protein